MRTVNWLIDMICDPGISMSERERGIIFFNIIFIYSLVLQHQINKIIFFL